MRVKKLIGLIGGALAGLVLGEVLRCAGGV
jgi:hypothetical protein